MRITAAGNPSITGRLSVATARDTFTDAVAREEWIEHVRAGRAFGAVGDITAAGANFPVVTLNSVAASTVRHVVFAVLVFSPTAQEVVLGFDAQGGAGVAGKNRLVGGADSVGVFATLTPAAALVASPIIRGVLQANVLLQLELPGRFEIATLAGIRQRLIVEGKTVTTRLVVTFAYAEM